jgi:hypothetical protein
MPLRNVMAPMYSAQKPPQVAIDNAYGIALIYITGPIRH